MSATQEIIDRIKTESNGRLEPEDVIANLQATVKALAEENVRLEDKIESLEADNAQLRDAIINSFVSDWCSLPR